MHLPNELLLNIFQSLGRTDLKLARLVCQSWDPCASHFLFDRIHVAPNKIDIQVFDAITQHPILSKCVRHLVYDAATFTPDLTEEDYFEEFFRQVPLIERKGEASPENTDAQIVDLVRDCTRSEFELPFEWREKQVPKWKDHSFFHPGYQAYQEHSVYQQRALQSGRFRRTLVQGLSRLSRLRSVSLQGGWTPLVVANLGEHHYGTPLARTWNPFHCFPSKWLWEPGVIDLHFGIITTALARAKTHIGHIAEFAIDGNFMVDDRYLLEDRARVKGLRSGIAALSGIKRLHFDLEWEYLDLSAPKYAYNVEGLLKLLGSMHSLQRLHISASSYRIYDRVFLKVTTWNNLEDLTVERLASTTTDLLRLLLIQMPRLRNLVVRRLDLLDHGNCWASLMECLRQFHHFTTFEMEQHQGWFYMPSEEPHVCDVARLVDYVMNGGRHPCLSEQQPASASEAYMLQIDASLRDSLYEMKRPRAQTTI